MARTREERETAVRRDDTDELPHLWTVSPAQARRWQRLGYDVASQFGSQAARWSGRRLVRSTPRFLHDFGHAIPNTHLAVATTHVDADMFHGRSPLRPKYQGPCDGGQPLHPFLSSPGRF